MRKLITILLVMLFFSCTSTKSVVDTKLYEVLNFNDDGGANIKFYEILTETKEINMLLSDPNLKRKINADDLEKCNFIILNMGPLPAGNNTITIDKIEETNSNIIIEIKEIKPQSVENNPINEQDFVYPYSVVRIKSKKPIIIK